MNVTQDCQPSLTCPKTDATSAAECFPRSCRIISDRIRKAPGAGSPEVGVCLQTEKRLQRIPVQNRSSLIHLLPLRQKELHAWPGKGGPQEDSAGCGFICQTAQGRAWASRPELPALPACVLQAGDGSHAASRPGRPANCPEHLPGGWGAAQLQARPLQPGVPLEHPLWQARRSRRFPRHCSANPASKHCAHLAWQGWTVGHFIKPSEITLGFCPAG